MSWSCHGRQPPAPVTGPGDVVAVSRQVECWWLVTRPALDGYKNSYTSPGWQTSSWVNEGREERAGRQGLPMAMEGGCSSFVASPVCYSWMLGQGHYQIMARSCDLLCCSAAELSMLYRTDKIDPACAPSHFCREPEAPHGCGHRELPTLFCG